MKVLPAILALGIGIGAAEWKRRDAMSVAGENEVQAQATPPLIASPAPTPAAIQRTEVSTQASPARATQKTGGNGRAAINSDVQIDSDEPRKFDATLEQIIPGGSAVAIGCFYDIPPSLTVNPERLNWRQRNWTQAGRFYITGLSGNEIDGQKFVGWLVRSGTKTYTTVLGAYKTVPAYTVVADPPATPQKPGAWMNQLGRTALDR